jgi:Domain of unknown function (DUF5753)
VLAALPAWLRDWTSHEQSARHLRDWCPSIVTGLLQTEDYARGASATTPMVTDNPAVRQRNRGRRTGRRLDRTPQRARGRRRCRCCS